MKMKIHHLLLAVVSLAVGASLYAQAQPPDKNVVKSKASHATVPIFVENNRPYIDLEFTRSDGSVRKARFILDTGGGSFVLAESLANDIGLKPTGPIIGALGGNVLRAFRVEIDYANGATYLEKTGSLEQNDLDIVGLTLRPTQDGGYVVSAVSRQGAGDLVDKVREGDKLISVDKLQVTGATLAEVVKALRGKIGETKTLTIERDGNRITVQAVVARIL